MASSPIELYTLEANGTLYVSGPELFDAAGVAPEALPGLKKQTITLTPRFTQAQQDEVERAVQSVNPLTGQMTTDETKRAGAMVEQYVSAWDFNDDKGAIPASADGYARLHPLVAAEIRNRIAARVFPSFVSCPDFTSALLSKQREKSSSGPTSETPLLTPEPPAPA